MSDPDVTGLAPGLYDRHAASWDDARQDLVHEEPWLARLSTLAGPGSHLLDVGCGTGRPIAAYLIGLGHRVTGVDVAASLVERARERFPAHEWLLADMRTLDLARRYDAVVAWSSLFHLTRDEQRATLPRLVRHLRPGGHLLLTTGDRDGEAYGDLGGEPLFHASLDPAEYRSLLEALGLVLLEHTVADPAYGGLTIWLARREDPPGAGPPPVAQSRS